MDRRQINSLSGIDIPSLGFEDIRFMFGTGVSESDGFGRQRKRSLRKGVQTQIGDIREDLWYQLAEQVIGLHGETWLLEALEVWCREEMHYPRYGFDLHKEALDLHSHRIFDSLCGGGGGLTIYLSTGGSGRRWWKGAGSPKSGWTAVTGR